MYLKRLDMYGFKSFKDKLSIAFDSNITAIVGPNGSGKSNITDAIRWVLGEQSVKSLRGSRMEDVIFAGTANHKPLGLAEVSLVLDNSTGIFSGEYSEICVTRRVYRSGESEYFINKTPCRLRDIHELFMDTGLGRDGYSIISQGKIDSILSAKAEDRRQIFEEAAGISKYKYKKTEASRKLDATEENLVRIRDIAGELSARIGPLEQQAKKARNYIDLYEKLKTLEINLSVIDIENLQATQTATEDLYQKSVDAVSAETEALAALKAEEETLYKEINTRDIEMEKTRALLHGTALSVKEWEGDNALLRQRMENYTASMTRLYADIRSILEENERLNAERETALCAEKAYLEKMQASDAKIADARQVLSDMTEAISIQNRLTEDLAAAVAQLSSDAENIKRRAASLEDADVSARLAALYEENTLSEKRLQDACAAKEADAARMDATIARLAAQEKKLQKQEDAKTASETKLQTLKENYNGLMRQYNMALSKKNALSDMEQNMDGYGKGVKAVLGAKLSADIRGVLSKLIETDKKYVTAVETALGGALQNIVVGDENDAKTAIAFLKSTRGGRATFLPISAIRGKRLEVEKELAAMEGYVGLACDLVQCDKPYHQIILHLLGSVVVMDSIENAIRVAKKFSHQLKIVTTEGELFLRGGSMSGGSHASQSNLLGRSQEIARLSKDCHVLQKELDKTEESIDDTTEHIRTLQRDIEALRAALGKDNAEKQRLFGSIQLSENIQANEKKHIARLLADIDSLHAQIENREAEQKRLAEELQKRLCDHAEAIRRMEEARAQLRTQMERRDKQNEALTKMQVEAAEGEKDKDAICDRINRLLLEVESNKARIAEKEAEKTRLSALCAEMQLRLDAKILDIENANTQMKTLEETISSHAAKKGDASTRTASLREEIQAANDRLLGMEGEKTRLAAKLEKIEQELDDTINHLWDAYELTFSAAVAFRCDIGALSTARTEAASLKRAIRNLGSVNIDAIEEYQEVRTRFDYLSGQITDLENARASLEKIIREMTEVMTKTFSERFAAIQAHFQNTFRALFGGGTAKLSLTDPSNVLESGIEIDVQPPGKKLQSLTLLSGGEKALCAIAILFAVMHVRPAPFCILDEIESALDDHNITRFAGYLRDYKDTQFIIVTHRRGTMEAADILYGVTMQEKGISKLLAMRLDEVKLHEEGAK